MALWDVVLRAVDGLSGPGPPERRVLLVVTRGEEGRESRHPMTSCAAAADSARVAIWVLSPATPEAAARGRLEALAQRTGGLYVDARGRGASVLAETVGRIRAVQGLRLAHLSSTPPFALTMRPQVASALPGKAWVRERRALGLAGKSFPILPVAAALLAALVAGGLVGLRSLPLGRVRITASGEAVPVTRSGLTIGGATGNHLVLADPRVSRSHAVIRPEKGRVLLVDLRSANGTTVNGRAISSVALSDGDRIRLADAVDLVWEEGFRFGKGR
jgi:hypothetical protein